MLFRSHRGYLAAGAVGVVLLGFAARAHDRNADWLDPQRFWLSGPDAAPGSYKTNMAAAANTVIVNSADATRSIRYAERALAILDGLPDSENSPAAYRDAAVLFRNLGDLSMTKDAAGKASAGPEARRWFQKSLDALLRSERIELAADQRYKAENLLRGQPVVTSVPSKLYLELGRAYLRLSDIDRKSVV